VEDELTYRLAPLSVVGQDASLEEIAASPAVRLFQERAGARARGSLGTERARRVVADICRRVDGLPLAIELAAARVAGLDLEDISLHLDDLFDLLPQAARRADGAQRSLRATVAWSDALLSLEERRLLRRMGAFAGRFELLAIKEVCAESGQTAAQVADLTARLVEKSLLLKPGDGGGYLLLETIRQYCIEQLTAAGEIDAVRERHARFYLGVARQECIGLMTANERPHLDLIASEEPIPVGDAGPQLDREALRQYRKRLAHLDEQLDEAEAQHHAARHAKWTAEREALLAELARATGLGGKPRRTGSPTEKARLNVTRTIRHAITYLSTTS
ncbi:MAG TPA: hypothetical protein VIK01_29495, partial [Polyangiaceae bacterium]